MQKLDEILRATKSLFIALTLISVGVIMGLIMATVIPDGLPRTPESQAEVLNTMAAASVSTVDDLSVPPTLLSLPEPARTPLPSLFVEVAQRVVPAVVSVESRRNFTHPQVRGPRGDFFRRLFPDDDDDEEDNNQEQGDDEEEDGGRGFEVPSSGSGFLFDGSGYLFTNDHVVSGSEHLSVHLADGRVYEAWVVGTDPGTDVAVLKIDVPEGDPPLPTIPLGNSDEIRVGDWAIAVGNPLGELESSMTVGIISAKGRNDLRIAGGGPTYQNFIQTDASINFGNSGGPLVNARGEVIGINSAINPSGQGLGFTIPINMAREIGRELVQSGTIRRGYLGILPQEVTDAVRDGWDMPDLAGILVGSVEDGTPAEEGGLKVGDVILAFNDSPLANVPEFRGLVAAAGVGVEVPILLLRDRREREITVVLAERPDTQAPPSRRVNEQGPVRLGATMMDISRPLAQEYDLDTNDGVVVTDVQRGGPAFRRGLRVGDVILELNRDPIHTKKDLDRQLQEVQSEGKSIVFLVQRGATTAFVEIPAGG